MADEPKKWAAAVDRDSPAWKAIRAAIDGHAGYLDPDDHADAIWLMLESTPARHSARMTAP